MVESMCPVCGYKMEEPPRDYNICPSCGTEFGNHDLNASIEDLRKAWLRTGPRWWSETEPQPKDWNPFKQLLILGQCPGPDKLAERLNLPCILWLLVVVS